MQEKNQEVIVTGANGGLGRAVVSAFLESGYKVHLLDLAFDETWISGLSASATTHEVSLLDKQALEALQTEFSEVSALVNVAGGFDMGPMVHETSAELWDKMFDLNVQTLRNICEVMVPMMTNRSGGAIVNIGAAGAISGAPNMGAYIASKSTVMRLTESMSEELKSSGINVNAVLPSVIDTVANREAMPDADHSQWVTPEQLANVIVFLCSDAASGVHGALIPVRNLA